MTQMSGGGSFRVDPERAPEAIRELEYALSELEAIKSEAVSLGNVDPGSADSVSVDAARAIGAVATGGRGSLTAALEVGIRQINDLVASMKADLADYQRQESDAARRLRES